MEEQKLGIDQVKKALKAGFSLTEKINVALEDGKVTTLEGVGIAVGALPDVFFAIKNGKEIKAQWVDLDEEESAEIKAWFADEFDIPNDTAEVKIEAIFNWLVVTSDTIMVVKG